MSETEISYKQAMNKEITVNISNKLRQQIKKMQTNNPRD